MLPTVETFPDALHKVHTAEEQRHELAAMHKNKTLYTHVPPRHVSAGEKGSGLSKGEEETPRKTFARQLADQLSCLKTKTA